jgi:hypothetical protein
VGTVTHLANGTFEENQCQTYVVAHKRKRRLVGHVAVELVQRLLTDRLGPVARRQKQRKTGSCVRSVFCELDARVCAFGADAGDEWIVGEAEISDGFACHFQHFYSFFSGEEYCFTICSCGGLGL